MAGAVVLLVLPGLLVLPDDVLLVVVDVHAADYAGLRPAVHHLPIEVERRCLVAEERALARNRSRAARAAGVDPRIVRVDVFREIDVRPADMEKAVRIAPASSAASARFTTSYGTAATWAASSGLGRIARKGLSRMGAQC